MAIVGTFGADFSAFVSEVAKANTALDALQESANAAQAGLTDVASVDASGLASGFEGMAGILKDLATSGTAAADAQTALVSAAGGVGRLTDDYHDFADAVAQVADHSDQAATAQKGAADAGLNLGSVLGHVGSILGVTFSVAGALAFGQAVLQTAGDIQKMADSTGLATGEVQGLMAVAAASNSSVGTFTNAITGLEQKIGSGDAGLIGATKALGLEWQDIRTKTPYDAFITYSDALTSVTDANQRAVLGNEVFGKSWKDLAGAVKDGVRDVADAAPKMSDATVKMLNDLDKKITDVKTRIKIAAAEMIASLGPEYWDDKRKAAEDAARALEDVGLAVPKVGAAARAVVEPLQVSTAATMNLAIQQRLLEADVRRAADAVAKATPEYKAWADATAALNAVGASWWDTLRGIDGAVVEAIKWYTDAGVSQNTLATAYELTATQVSAVVNAYRAEKTAADAAAKATDDVTMALSRQIVQRALDQQKMLEADVTSHSYYEKLARDAAKAYADATAAGDEHTTARIEQLRLEAEAAQTTLDHWQDAADKAMHGIAGPAKQARDEIESLNDTLARLSGENFGAPAGVQSAGQGRAFSSVGDGLLAVPMWGVPGAGGILNMSAGAVTINYPIMDDPQARDQIGRVVGDAILERVTRTGARV